MTMSNIKCHITLTHEHNILILYITHPKDKCFILEGWNSKTSYRFTIIHLPEQGLIRLRLYEGSTLVLDSGNIIDTGADRLSGGKLGVYCDSQENISWSALRYR